MTKEEIENEIKKHSNNIKIAMSIIKDSESDIAELQKKLDAIIGEQDNEL